MWVTFFPVLFFIMSIGNLIVWYVGGYQVIQDSSLGAQLLPDRNFLRWDSFLPFSAIWASFTVPCNS